MSRARKPRPGADLVGRAFFCNDGVIRWVESQTMSTKNLRVRWWADDSKVWHEGGAWAPDKFIAIMGEERPAPQPGEVYEYVGLIAIRQKFRRGGPDEIDVRVFE